MACAPKVVAKAQVAPDDVFEQAHREALDELEDHVLKHGGDGIETLVGMAYVGEAGLVEEDLLDDEDGDGLGELGACLHDAQAKGNDLGGEEEVNDSVIVILLDDGV
jgi:hypothetical protein